MLACHERPTEYVVAAAPVPARAMVCGELVAVLTTVTVPLRFPAVVGSKMALKLADCPAARVIGRERPL